LEVLILISGVRTQNVLLALKSCNTRNIMYYTAVLFHKLVFLVLVWFHD